MDTVYTTTAIIGGTLLVCQFLLTLMGVAGAELHEDIGEAEAGGAAGIGGADGGSGDHGSGDHGPSVTAGMFTIRGISAAAAFFGLVGLAGTSSGWQPVTAGVTASAAGVGGLILVGIAVYMLHSLRSSGTLRLRATIGCRGTVYLSIPAERAGTGKVHLSVQQRLVELSAVTAGPALPNGTDIVVRGLTDVDTVEVTVAPKS